MKYSILGLAAVGVASVAHAATSVNLDINNGGFRFALGNIMGSYRTSASGGLGNPGQNLGFGKHAVGDPTVWGFSGGRELSQQWWWYRSNGDTRQYGLSNQTSYELLAPNQARIIYTEPSNNGTVANALRFTFTYTLHGDAASDQALMIANWSIENLTETSQSVALISYADPNAGGLDFIGQNVWSYNAFADRSELRLNAASSVPEIYMTFGALGNLDAQNDLWGSTGAGGPSPTFSRNSMAFFSSIYNAAHANGVVSQAMTTTGTAGAGGAIEWMFNIPVGGSYSGAAYIGYNSIPTPSAAVLLGFGGVFAARRQRVR